MEPSSITNMILALFIILSCLQFGIPYLYYLYMKRMAGLPSGIQVDEDYEPHLSLIVATYNESSIIERKMKNIRKLDYPSDKLEVIIVDSSTDDTVEIINNYLENTDFPFNIKILKEKERKGKAKALNYALENAIHDTIALSDADSFWEPDSLKNSVKYMNDKKVGAITGREKILNLNKNLYTQAEGAYRDSFYNTMRLGESKIHSTMMFQGEYSIYKKNIFSKFNEEKGSDDIGTVINIIKEGYRTVFAPEAVFWDTSPTTLKSRISLKTRRALHVILGLSKAMKLKRANMFPQPSLILYTNYYIHVVNPMIFVLLIAPGLYIIYKFPFLLLFSTLLMIGRIRVLLVTYLTGTLSLLLGIISYLRGEEQTIWKKIEEMREHEFDDPEINKKLF